MNHNTEHPFVEPLEVEVWSGTSGTVIVIDANETELFRFDDIHPDRVPDIEKRFRRIVAAVNACAGIPTEMLESRCDEFNAILRSQCRVVECLEWMESQPHHSDSPQNTPPPPDP